MSNCKAPLNQRVLHYDSGDELIDPLIDALDTNDEE